MRIVLAGNAAAGSHDDDVVARVRAVLGRMGEVVDADPRSVASVARAGDLVVAAGGDGTMNAVVNALGPRDDLDFALVPMGTGNDLARSLGLPLDPVDAAAALVDGSTTYVDVGRARGDGVVRLFVNACMGGFPVQVDRSLADATKERLGPLAFYAGAVKAAAGLQRATVVVDGAEIEDCVAVGVGVGRTAGGGLAVFPDAVLDDGLLDCSVFVARGPAGAIAAAVRAVARKEVPPTHRARGESLRIEARPPIEFNVDGELGGPTTPAVFDVAGRIRMRSVPDQRPAQP